MRAARPGAGRAEVGTTARRVGVVGAGIVGLAIARRLAEVRGDEVVVFEKEPDLALHQTGHNSGVVHSGLYYKPGSLKAVLCRRGVELLEEFCEQHALEYRRLGKVVVARNEVEVARLRDIEARAHANGVPEVRWLDAAALREIEPNVRGLAALHSPTTAIVDYRQIARAMADDVRAHGGQIHLGRAITGIERGDGGRVTVSHGEDRDTVDELIVCAGLQSDLVARLAGDERSPAIVPFRGEYHRLTPRSGRLVNGLVYPVPDPAYPFLGVHITPRVDGTVDVGPNAVFALAREGYLRRDVNVRDAWQALAWPGTRRLFRAHWRTGLREMHGSLSRRAFAAAAREYLPALTAADLVRAPAGVRAQAVDRDGSLVDDFRISSLGPVTAIRNAPSPAATSSLAIAEHVVDRILSGRTR